MIVPSLRSCLAGLPKTREAVAEIEQLLWWHRVHAVCTNTAASDTDGLGRYLWPLFSSCRYCL